MAEQNKKALQGDPKLERESLLKQAEDYLEQSKMLVEKEDIEKALELAKKAANAYEALKVWEKGIEARVFAGGFFHRLPKGSNNLSDYLEDTLYLAEKHLEKNHPLFIEVFMILGGQNTLHTHLDTALVYYKKALELQRLTNSNHFYKLAHICFCMGRCYWGQSNFHGAIEVFEKSIDFYQKVDYDKNPSNEDLPPLNVFQSALATSHSGLASCSISIGKIEVALKHLQEALNIYQNASGEMDIETRGMIYTRLGHCYRKKRDIGLAKLHYQKCLSLFIEHCGKNHQLLVGPYSGIASCYELEGFFEEAIEYSQLALKISTAGWGEEHINTIACYAKLGYCYKRNKQYQEALQNFHKALNIRIKLFGDNNLVIAEYYTLIGTIYLDITENEEALSHFQKGLKIRTQLLGNKNPQLTESFLEIAVILKNQKLYEKSLNNLQNALIAICTDFNDTNFYQNPRLQKFSIAPILLNVLWQKGQTAFLLFKNQSNQHRDYELSLQTIQLADELIGKMRKDFRLDTSQLNLSKIAIPVYEQGIKLACSNLSFHQNPSLAFAFAEKAKAFLLLSSVQESFAKQASNIPKRLLQQEIQLKKDLTHLEKKIERGNSKKNQTDDSAIQKWKSQFFDLHQEYLQLIQQFETDYPDYYQLKYETKTTSIEEVQQALTKHQVLLNYFVADQHFYIFVVTKDEFEVFDFDKPDDFEALIQDFLFALNNHDHAIFAEKSHQLFRLLIQPIEDFVIDPFGEADEEELKHLLIIPHGELTYLPFEALLCTQEPLPKLEAVGKVVGDMDYLIHYCKVSYHYSATLWHYLLTQRKRVTGGRAEADNSFVGFAPVYLSEVGSRMQEVGMTKEEEALKEAAKEVTQWATRSEALRSDGSWTPLPHSKIEAENISALFEEKGFDSQAFLHEAATKEQFREVAEKSRFLLIAAHGLVNDEHPKLSGLVFFPEKQEVGSKKQDLTNENLVPTSRFLPLTSNSDCILSMEETYHLNLQADLVVLSSCESGIGTLAKGEGMMAVNRGFLYAGAKNVVSTLFKVYDEQSSLLTQYLFEEILGEEDFVSALRKAKLKLMKQEGVDAKSWCGFVLIGS